MNKIKAIKKKAKRYLLAKLLKGNNITCNICDGKYTTFIPHLNRINACCPNCGSLERTRLVWYYIQLKKLLEGGTSLIHVAPDKSLYKIFKKEFNIDYHPIDKFTKGYKYPSGTVEMDISDLKFEDDTMDGIICLHVLEHVLDDRRALQEFYRVLKKDAWAIVLVPFDRSLDVTYEDASITSPTDRFRYFGQTDHVRIYGKDFIDRFRKKR